MNAPTGGLRAADDVRWEKVTDSRAWDRDLALIGGHPLQSALWGNARRVADGVEDDRFVAVRADGARTMARVESRPVPLIGGSVAWLPRGPAGAALDGAHIRTLARSLARKPRLVVTDAWRESESRDSGVETIWIDLKQGKDALWRNLDKEWRYGAGKGLRSGVVVEQSCSRDDQERLFALMDDLSEQKDFALPVSKAMIAHLVACDPAAVVSAHLFVARCEGAVGAAALILRCGSSIHYLFGGTDRTYSKRRAGEALHWSIIEWGLAEGAERYDLEGIDRRKNPGTYNFKKRMGGREVVLAGRAYFPISPTGVTLATLDRLRGTIAWPAWTRI